MLPVRLRSEPSVTALVLDAIVFIVAFPLALESDEAAWIRLVAGAFALAAAVLGARSVFLFYERHRSARQQDRFLA